MSLGDHLEELRARLIMALLGLGLATAFCLIFTSWIIKFLERPYVMAMGEQARLISLAPTDGFTCYMAIGMVAGAILASPWIFYQLWQFVAAGLYSHERKYVYLAMPFSTVLFILGAMSFVLWIAPATLKFLVTFNRNVMGVDSNFTFTYYVSFIALMTLIFGLAFQTPIVVFCLYKIGLTPLSRLRSWRKYIFFGIVVIAAAVIPGSDPFSLFGLVIPVYGLYELGIGLCWHSERKKRKAAPAETVDAYDKRPD
jgi:sec-independent protein translocase protein TatC